MHKIDTQTAVNGEFTDGNPSTGVKATQLNAGWFNSVQRELCNAVEKFGIALSKEDDMQLWKVVSALGVKTFSPWEGDFGGWPGNSVIVMDAVETVYFPVPDRCPKNAIAIVSVPWMESDTSLTVAQNEGSSAPLFRGNIGLVFFDANGYASEVKNMPVSATGIPLLFLYAMEGKLETLTVNGEAKLPGATFTPATSSVGVPVAKLSYLKVLESLDVEKGMTVKGKAEFESVKGKTLDIAGRAKAVTFEGKVETNNISAKDSSKPINVSAISGFNITGKSSVSGDFSSGSLKTGKIAYENLNLNDNMGIAPVLPYFLDNSGIGIKNLSEILAEAPKGARITFINNSGKDKEYHFTTTDVEGVAGGYFTLKAGRAVDIIVNNVLSVSQVSLLPIGIDYEEGGNL